VGEPAETSSGRRTPHRSRGGVPASVLRLALAAVLAILSTPFQADAAPYGWQPPIQADHILISQGPNEDGSCGPVPCDHNTQVAGSAEAIDFAPAFTISAPSCQPSVPVYATDSGIITIKDTRLDGHGGGYGYYAVIASSAGSSLYGHMLRGSSERLGFPLDQSTSVSRGRQIGEVGSTGNSTGCHLHYQLTDSASDPQSGTPIKVFNAPGFVAWPFNSGRAFFSQERAQTFGDAYMRMQNAGRSLGYSRPESPNDSVCPPSCLGVGHFWNNDTGIWNNRSGLGLVVQNYNGPDNQEFHPGLPADDGIIARYERMTPNGPVPEPVFDQNSSLTTQAFAIRGGIWNVYAGQAGPYGPCGIPVSDELILNGAVDNLVTHKAVQAIAYFRPNPMTTSPQLGGALAAIYWEGGNGPVIAKCPGGGYASIPSGGAFAGWPGSFGGVGGGAYDPQSWSVQYFGDKNLGGGCHSGSVSGPFLFADWGEGSPGGNCPSDNFSARMQRTVHFDSGTYNFALFADDWGRMYVDGHLVVDGWNGATQHYEGYAPGQGDHSVTIEYAETLGAAKTTAWWWQDGDLPREQQDPRMWYLQYWGTKDLWWDSVVRRNVSGSFINLPGLGSSGPGWGIPPTNFSIRGEKTVAFAGGNYQFHLATDDGGRLWIDNQSIIDEWHGQGAVDHVATVALSPGDHIVKFDQYQDGGDASVSLNWDALPPSNDGFASAVQLQEVAQTGETMEAATAETAEPTSCGEAAKSVWYWLVPSHSGQLSATLQASDFNGSVGIFQGSNLADLGSLGCATASADTSSAVAHAAVAAGSLYFIQVAAPQGVGGQFNLQTALAPTTVTPQPSPTPLTFGTGADLDRTVNGVEDVNPQRAAAAGTVGDLTLTTSAPIGAPMQRGDVILVQQARGVGAGQWELNQVLTVSGSQFTLAQPLAHSYLTDPNGASRAQVVRVLQFRNLTIPAGSTISPSVWDGFTGGITAFLVSGELSVDGSIDVSARGFAGGRTR
jgi:hypothetical protein